MIIVLTYLIYNKLSTSNNIDTNTCDKSTRLSTFYVLHKQSGCSSRWLKGMNLNDDSLLNREHSLAEKHFHPFLI